MHFGQMSLIFVCLYKNYEMFYVIQKYMVWRTWKRRHNWRDRTRYTFRLPGKSKASVYQVKKYKTTTQDAQLNSTKF